MKKLFTVLMALLFCSLAMASPDISLTPDDSAPQLEQVDQDISHADGIAPMIFNACGQHVGENQFTRAFYEADLAFNKAYGDEIKALYPTNAELEALKSWHSREGLKGHRAKYFKDKISPDGVPRTIPKKAPLPTTLNALM